MIGFWGSTFGLSVAVGPIVGGALVDSVGWRGVFWINIPVCLAAIALTAIYVPGSRGAVARHLDPFGQILVMILLGMLSYAMRGSPCHRVADVAPSRAAQPISQQPPGGRKYPASVRRRVPGG